MLRYHFIPRAVPYIYKIYAVPYIYKIYGSQATVSAVYRIWCFLTKNTVYRIPYTVYRIFCRTSTLSERIITFSNVRKYALVLVVYSSLFGLEHDQPLRPMTKMGK